jgi:DNA-binding CsgD family transcriptional regulator
MYIESLNTFTHFLADSKRSLDDISKYLVLHTFKHLQPRAIYIGEAEESGNLILKTSFGFEPQYIKQWTRIPLTLSIPVVETIKSGEPLFLKSQEDFFGAYPEVEQLGEVDREWTSCIASPVGNLGSYFLVLNKVPVENKEHKCFLKAIGNLIALHFQEFPHMNPNQKRKSEGVQMLSARQSIIRDLLAKGYTNAEIANEIGYSESLVRQESIAIYSALHISGRKELIRQTDNSETKA